MKKLIFSSMLLLSIAGTRISAQEMSSDERFGNTLNLGVGAGYYGYVGHSMAVFHADYEFETAKNLTVAPFITFYSYENNYYWGDPHYPYRNYSYRTVVVPIGAKGTYYFDEILEAGPKWDFYLAASLGFAIRKTTWENGYNGETTIQHGSSGLYLDGHIGAEYHLGAKTGLFLDLSTGISTFGLAIHMQ